MRKKVFIALIIIAIVIGAGTTSLFYGNGIPVLIYHHVNYNDEPDTLSPELFEKQMKFLVSHGYQTIFFDELIRYIKYGKKLPSKAVVITFDDGYLDNWIYAYPVLKKYGLKATLFVITCKIKDRPEKYRPNLEDVWNGEATEQELPFIDTQENICLKGINNEATEDYLTWSELKEMEETGVISIQSHTHYHRRCFVSDKILNFMRGKNCQVAQATEGDMRAGIPIYPMQSSVIARKYIDDKRLRDYLANYVRQKGYLVNSDNNIWKAELNNVVEDFKAQYGLQGHYETLEESKRRIRQELGLSKKIIEERLKKKCEYLAWPWGVYSDISVKIAQECGFVALATGEGGSDTGRSDIRYIKRVGIGRYDDDVFGKVLIVYSNPVLVTIWKKVKKIILSPLKHYYGHIRRSQKTSTTLSALSLKHSPLT